MKILMFTLLSIFTMFSCTAKDHSHKERQATDMLSFSYNNQGSMAYGRSYSAVREGDSVLVIISEDSPDEYHFTIDTSIFTDLQEIINRNEIYKYKANYQSKLKILDGNSWSIYIRYNDDNLSISSKGTNAYPKGSHQAFNEIREYFINHFIKKDE